MLFVILPDMTKIRLVLSDIDGTIVPLLGTEPSQRVKETVRQLQESGIEIAPVTGRPYDMAKDLFRHIGFQDVGVFDAGASVRKIETGEVVWKNWLSIARIKTILSILLPVSDVIDFFPDFKEVKARQAHTADVIADAPYVFAFIHDNSAGKTAIELLKQDKSLSVNVHYTHESWEGFLNVQITDHEADKYHGVTALRELVDSSIEETLAIGDSGNDIPLFKAAGLKIAMGNAIEELKALADYVVADVDNDGFAEAMERFVLN